MSITNLTTISDKKNIILTIVKRYLNKYSDKVNNRQIIDNFTHIKQYGVLSMPAFRMSVDQMIQKSPTGSIIMADINDLFVANKFRGKNKVNSMIKSIINKIKNTLDKSECLNYKIGKMGDEIYIYMPDKNEQQTSVIVEKIHCIRESELTISSGASSDLKNGIINAITEADKKMVANKKKFKCERLKSICGDNLVKIIDIVVETQLDKMRIDLEQLRNSNKSDLRNSFDRAIEQLDIEEILTSTNHNTNFKSQNKDDTFKKLKDRYTSQAQLIYGNNHQLVNEYIFASMLSKHPLEGVLTSEFFQGLGYKKVYRNIKKDKTAKTFDILAIDLSGLKSINDTLGHEEGDNAISDVLKYMQETLKSNNIKMYSEIIAKGGGNSYVLIEQLCSDAKNNILSNIEKYGTNDSYKYNMSIMCSIQSINKNTLDRSSFINVINSHLTEAEDNLQKQSFDRKLKDVDEIKNSIKRIYQQVINMDDVQLLLNNELGYKEKVLEMVKVSFKNCIEEERHTPCLTETIISIDLKKVPQYSKNLDDDSNNKTK